MTDFSGIREVSVSAITGPSRSPLNCLLGVPTTDRVQAANLTPRWLESAVKYPAPKVVMLCDNYAQAEARLIEAAQQDHLVLKAS